MARLSHLDSEGRARMVDVTDKDTTSRIAVARGMICMRPETLDMIVEKKWPRGMCSLWPG